MEKLYVDESGTMTVTYCNIHPYFVVAIVRTKDPERLKHIFRRFVKKNISELRATDRRGSMFNGDDFVELKGNCLTPELKRRFVSFFCQNDLLEVFYIVADNHRVKKNLYDNTARAFNYLIRLALEFCINHGYIQNSGIDLQLDERNESPDAKRFLENYLNTELLLRDVIKDECKVTYFNSENNLIIQIADVFANLYFSQLKTNAYTEEFDKMGQQGYVKYIFKFPLNNKTL